MLATFESWPPGKYLAESNLSNSKDTKIFRAICLLGLQGLHFKVLTFFFTESKFVLCIAALKHNQSNHSVTEPIEFVWKTTVAWSNYLDILLSLCWLKDNNIHSKNLYWLEICTTLLFYKSWKLPTVWDERKMQRALFLQRRRKGGKETCSCLRFFAVKCLNLGKLHPKLKLTMSMLNVRFLKQIIQELSKLALNCISPCD